MRFLETVALVALLLAGCSGDSPAATPSVTVPAHDEPLPDFPDYNASDEAPTALLGADPVAGKAPLGVNLSLAGTDPEGKPLHWALDLDGDGTADRMGTSLPSTVSHDFAVGTHLVQLAVDDGNRITVTYLEITAEA